MASQQSKGQLFILSAPSGVGKTTLVQSLVGRVPDLHFSISCTTRAPRPGEADGTDYCFIDAEAFLRGIRTDRFLEWAHVHGQYYGTERAQVEHALQAGKDVLLDIDVQGARQIRAAYPLAHTVFIIPPSLEILQQRLQLRGTESPEQISLRISNARRELQEAPWYDFVVINDAIHEALADLIAIIRAIRCHRLSRAGHLHALLTTLDSP
jgi:guanylate kinase